MNVIETKVSPQSFLLSNDMNTSEKVLWILKKLNLKENERGRYGFLGNYVKGFFVLEMICGLQMRKTETTQMVFVFGWGETKNRVQLEKKSKDTHKAKKKERMKERKKEK